MTFPIKKIACVVIVFGLILMTVLIRTDRMEKKNSTASVTDLYHCPDCNVVLITMTNLRYDHMSVNGYARNTTPKLDAFAKESVVFDNAFSHASWTLPEAISLYTSLYPYQHGVMEREDGSTLAEDTPTLINIFNAQEYNTALFTGGFDYYADFGLTYRFKTYEKCVRGQNNESDPIDPRVDTQKKYGELTCAVPKAISWLKKNATAKFFIHVQGFDAHCPFSQKPTTMFDPTYTGNVDYSNCLWTFEKTDPKIIDGTEYYPVYSTSQKSKSAPNNVLLSPKDVTQLVARYDQSIYDADTAIGTLLETIRQLNLEKNTIIIFTSEHGDIFGKYGRFMRGGPLRGTFYDDVLHIPLIMKLPGIAPARRSALTSHVDVMPTILDVLGVPTQIKMEGKSLRPVLISDTEINDAIFAGSKFTPDTDNFYFNQPSFINVIRTKEWKLIQETLLDQSKKNNIITEELYHVGIDKEETTNLATTNPAMLQQLRLQLDAWVKRVQ